MDWIRTINNAIEYMEAHLTERITLDDIAGNVNLSVFHFHRAFSMLTVEFLLLVAELSIQGHRPECADALVHYFTKRNIFYRTDDMKTPMVDVMMGTFYPPDPIKIGAHMIVYALRVLGCKPRSEAMQAGFRVLDEYKTKNGRYILTASKSVPAFKTGNVGEENKWVTLYAYMAR